MTIILLASLTFFIIITALRLDLALSLIVALLPSYLIRFNIFGIPMTFLEAMILISFAIWFIKATKLKLTTWFKGRTTRRPYPFGLEIIIILVLSFIAVGVSDFSLAAMGIWKAYFFEPILLFILIMNVFQDKVGRKKILLGLLLGALATALLAIFQQATGVFITNPFWANEETRRVVSWFGYPNAVGLFLAPLVLVLSGWLFTLHKEKKQTILKITIATTIILSAAAIYFAKSEGALIGIMAGAWLMAILANKYTRLAAIIGAIIISAFIFITPTYQTYALDKITLSDLSGEIRKQQWKETMETLHIWPATILGNGLSNYPQTVAPYHQEGIFFNRDKIENFDSRLYGSAELRAKYWQPVEIYLYPHNIFLNFWTELGLLGALAFMWLIIKYLVISVKLFFTKKNYLALGLFGAMSAILIHGLVDVPYFKNDLAALFFILLALLGILIAEQKFNSDKQKKI